MSKQEKDIIADWQVASASGGGNYGFLDGIRGIAILMVVASHTFYVNPESTGLVRIIGNAIHAGTLGVTVFFTLSGFLIALPFWKQKMKNGATVPPGYLVRRFWKIYPPLALTVLMFTPIYAGLYGNAGEYWKTASQWITGAAWVVPVSSRVNPVMWSLIVEVHFYLLLPLCFLILRRLSYNTALIAISSGFLLLPPICRQIYAGFGIQPSLHPVINVCFPVNLDAFAFGVLVAGLHARGWVGMKPAGIAPVGLLVLPVLLFHGVLGDWMSPAVVHYGVMLATACMLCFIGDPVRAASWGVNAAWLRWLGLISYEWYLIHQPLFFWSWRVYGLAGGNPFKYAAIVLTPMALGLVLAAVLYRYYSLPILKRTRGRTAAMVATSKGGGGISAEWNEKN